MNESARKNLAKEGRKEGRCFLWDVEELIFSKIVINLNTIKANKKIIAIFYLFLWNFEELTFPINWGKNGVRTKLCQGHYKVCIPHPNTKTSRSPLWVPQ